MRTKVSRNFYVHNAHVKVRHPLLTTLTEGSFVVAFDMQSE